MKSKFFISPMHRPQHNPTQLPCTVAGCLRWFKTHSGRTKHVRSIHRPPNLSQSLRRSPTPPSNDADGPDGVYDVSDDEGAGGRSSPLLFQPPGPHSAGSQSSPPPPSINRSPTPNNGTSLNYHPSLNGGFSPHLA